MNSKVAIVYGAGGDDAAGRGSGSLERRSLRRCPGGAVIRRVVAIDVPLALAIVGLGILIVIAPASVPGLTQPM